MATGMSNYRAPARTEKEDKRLGWLMEAVAEGSNANSMARTHMDLDSAAALIAGLDDDETIPDGLSKIKVPEIKRCLREIIGTLSNFGTLGTYSNDNKMFDQHSFVLNTLLESWWYHSFSDREWRKAIQYAAVFGTGYVGVTWEKDFWCYGRGDIALNAYGPDDVMFVQLPKSNDIQKAYAVIIKSEVPLNTMMATFPHFADKIVANHGTATWLNKGRRAVEKYLAPVLHMFGQGTNPREDQGNFPTCDVFTAYILDTSINVGPNQIRMGQPEGSSWCYTVPVWKSDIPSGTFTEQGQPQFHKATAEEAMLYPLRRRMIATSDIIIEDDSSPWWHGKVPLIQTKLDDWAWEVGGYSLIKDVKAIEDSNNNILRACENSMVARLDPALQFDEDQIAQSDMESLDPRQRGVRVATNFQMGDGIKPLLGATYYDVPTNILEHIKANEERIRHLLSVGAYQSLAKAKQVPSGEGIDKILEASSPIIFDQSCGLARGMRDMGEMCKSMFFQFYNAARRIQKGGPSMVVPEDYYFDPVGMVPSHLPGEDKESPSRTTQTERARWHQNNFIFNVSTKNLHDMVSMRYKLMLMQADKSGFLKIGPWAAAEILGVKDKYGKAPDEAGKSWAEQYLYWLGMQKAMAEEMGGEGGPGQGKGGGRPSSGKQAPHIQQKGGGQRSTVSESR